jgi:hypothetical protein
MPIEPIPMKASGRLVGVQMDIVETFTVLIRETVRTNECGVGGELDKRGDEGLWRGGTEMGIAQPERGVGATHDAVKTKGRQVAGDEEFVASALQHTGEGSRAERGGKGDRALIGVTVRCGMGREPQIDVIVIRPIAVAGPRGGAEELADQQAELTRRERL